MSRNRPADWSPLRLADPVPGDWELIEEAVARYRQTARDIEEAADSLDKISHSDAWESDAGRAFTEKAGSVGGKVRKAYGRYHKTADALAQYWPEFKWAQDRSVEILERAKKAQEDLRNTNNQMTSVAGGDEVSDQRKEQLKNQAETAQKEISDADGDLRRVEEAHAGAADDARKKIENYNENLPLADSFWDERLSFSPCGMRSRFLV